MNHVPVEKRSTFPVQIHPGKLAPVLHLINGEHFSGAERVQDLLGKALPSFGYQPSFVCLKEGKFNEQRQSVECPLHIEPMTSKLDFKTIRKIADIARDEQHQIIHAHTPRSLMIGRMVAKKTGCPLVYHVHSPVGRDSTRGIHNKLNQWVENWSLRQVDAMICVSRSLSEYMMQNGHPRSKIHVVTNGVCSLPELPQRNAPGKTWTIGTTALFRPRKGTEVLLESIASLKQQGVDVELLAVGPFESSQYEAQIKSLAEDLGIQDRITWTGFQHNVNEFFQKMDAFVLPSLFGEGLPMVILESMANGVPVVAANVEGVTEAIRHGVDGLVFKPSNVDELTSSLNDLISGKYDWDEMRENGFYRQRECFSDESMAAGVANVYRQILKSRYAANGK